MTREQIINEYVEDYMQDISDNDELRRHTEWLSQSLDRYAYHVGLEAMGEPTGEYFFGDVGFNLHRTQAIAKLKELTNQ